MKNSRGCRNTCLKRARIHQIHSPWTYRCVSLSFESTRLANAAQRKQVIVGVNQSEESIRESPREGNRHCRLLDYKNEE